MTARRLVDRGPLGLWFAVGCGVVVLALAGWLGRRGWEPAACLRVGETSPGRPLVERELGPVPVSPDAGHDGKYAYLIARRPWPWRADGETLAGLQDPAYRYGRPLYPAVAGLGGLLPPWPTLAGLIVGQIVAGGVLFAATVALARQDRLPTLAAVVALINPGVYSSAVLLTGDLAAFALGLAGLACWQGRRPRLAVGLFAAAVLAKEYYALLPLALAVANVRRPRTAAVLAVVPLLPLVGWRLLVAATLGVGQGGENFAWPGRGIVDTAAVWREPPVGWLGVATVALCLTGAARTGRPSLRWSAVGWGLLGLVASHRVWHDPTDLLRVVCPAWWLAVWCWSPRSAEDTP